MEGTTRAFDGERKILYCLDFDGVLCDSVNETFHSGLRACKLLWKEDGGKWIDELEQDPDHLREILDDFRYVRPILYVGWESILLIKFLACSYRDEIIGTALDLTEDIDDYRTKIRKGIFRSFHVTVSANEKEIGGVSLKEYALQQWGFSENDYGRALSNARKAWIAQEDTMGDDKSSDCIASTSWIDAHGFYHGACKAVREYLQKSGNEDIYIITTKAKEFALRLLAQQNLFSRDETIPDEQHSRNGTSRCHLLESHIFGLGSGPKASVLQSILNERQTKDTSRTTFFAVMVEDNVATLDKISKSPVGPKVMPVVASWGYNSNEQLVDVFLNKTRQNETSNPRNSYHVLPMREKSVSDGDTLTTPSVAEECARNAKKLDPTGYSLASILQTPDDAGQSILSL